MLKTWLKTNQLCDHWSRLFIWITYVM